jgi:serine phosphatase RsbU (regulator of sigma subunit)
MAALHACKDHAALDRAATAAFAEVAPGVPLLLGLPADGTRHLHAHLLLGGAFGCQHGAAIDERALAAQATIRLPLRFQEHTLGDLFAPADCPTEQLAALEAVLAHYAGALANLTLFAEARQATDGYCASLQTLEEGIVLFQEEDPAAVTARLLNLATTMVQASAGALYVLQEIGDPGSGLRLEQALGMPDRMLEGFAAAVDWPWPDYLLGQPAQFLERSGDSHLAEIPDHALPAVLTNVMVLPLRYHGIEAGLCLLFNANAESSTAREQLLRVQHLGQLGAALLHRLRLEAQNAKNRSIARELEIAEVIQRRLLPTKAPQSREFDFAWASVAAQNIGGDYLDLMVSELGDIYAVVADASGHGINSALLMSLLRSSYRSEAPWCDQHELLGLLNRDVCHEVGHTGMFITACSLRLEHESRRVVVANAGHPAAILLRAGAATAARLEASGPPLGFHASAAYSEVEYTLATGDLLVLFSDGITEATNQDLDMFGEDRLVATLLAHRGEAPQEILRALQAALATFSGRDRQEDDVSLLVIRAV